ncbi:RagB/SusD family nutrient uptake outer membrane protein [Hoylesella oralis]|uniref:RagB/SusD family nutrient uptake outer membrane protein n=1 Tax=Hoylesella oralis TaxID=28134 RepID=UPI0028E9C118|nr:RagB/SusD family nutrient uptake outer membrane protein [Hoylesella oralis]
MKKLHNKLIGASVLLTCTIWSLYGCTDVAEHPDGRLDMEEVFTNPTRVAGYLNSCYIGITRARGDNYGNYTMLASCTDEAHDVKDVIGSVASLWNNGSANAFSNPLAAPEIWNYYEYIRCCNVFLEHIPTARTYSETERQGYEGQAYGLRAYYYLSLIKNYGGVPLILKDTRDDNFDYSSLKRNTFSECVRQIISDCRHVVNNNILGYHSGGSDAERSMMCKGMAYAIMSEAALYAASPLNNDGTLDWSEAAKLCKEAVDSLEAHGYSLYKASTNDGASYNAYDAYFHSKSDVKGISDPETILEARNQMDIWKYQGMPIISGQTYAGSCPSQELIDSYETIDGKQPILGYSDENHLHPIINTEATLYDEHNPYANRDPRMRASVYYHGVPTVPEGSTLVSTADNGNCAISQNNVRYTRTGYYLRKYINCNSNRTLNSDGYFKIFRMAEMYLNYAEAANEATASVAPNEAVDAVNKVRSRVGMPKIPYGLSKEEFRTKVRHERQIELAFEEHRFYDVRRWKILDETGKIITGMKPINENGKTTFERFVVNRRNAYSDKYLRFAIPGKEVIKLKNKTGLNFQNEGW